LPFGGTFLHVLFLYLVAEEFRVLLDAGCGVY